MNQTAVGTKANSATPERQCF